VAGLALGRWSAWVAEQARATLQALRDEVTLLQALTDAMAQRWYAGHAPLFPAVAQDLAALSESVDHAAGLVARTGVAAPGGDFAAERGAGPAAADATEDLARADGLWLDGRL